MTYKVTQSVDYLDPNPVVTTFQEEWEALDFVGDCIDSAVQSRLEQISHELSEIELGEIQGQEWELIRIEEV